MSYQPAAEPPSPSLWLGLSIASTVLCCVPLGIVGIVFAAQAMEAKNRGDIARWDERARRARTWTLWSIFIILVPAVIAAGAGVISAIVENS